MKEAIRQLLMDAGIFLTLNVNTAKWILRPIRNVVSGIALDSRVLMDPIAETETQLIEPEADLIIYAFADKAFNYKPSTIAIADDGQATYQKFPKAKEVELESVIHFNEIHGASPVLRSIRSR